MEYVIAIVLIILVVLLIALILKKRIYDSIHQVEAWKDEIKSRNIGAELSKMKDLNLHGEAFDNLDEWKNLWEVVITDDLANVEVSLSDAKTYANHFKFSSSRKSLSETETRLEKIEKDITLILNQLNEYLEIEKSGRNNVEKIKPKIKEMQETITENKQSYGKGTVRFEKDFEKLNQALITYDELVSEGEYHQAKKIVDQVNKDIKQIQLEMEEYVDLYRTCKIELPEKIDELNNGLEEMAANGYPVESLGLSTKMGKHQQELLDAVKEIELKSIDKSKEIIPKIEASIQEMYDVLEQEVSARKFLQTEMPAYKEALEVFRKALSYTKDEIVTLKKAYQFSKDDLDKEKKLEMKFNELVKKEIHLTKNLFDKTKPLAKLEAELKEGFNHLEYLEIDHQEFIEDIHTLRKDELLAREKLENYNDQLDVALKKLRTNNLPGVPQFIWEYVNEADLESNKVVLELSKTPIDIKAIKTGLDELEDKVNITKEQIDTVIEKAHLTELVIQYANRYRSSHPHLAESLADSERLFKAYEYEIALHTAASAVESIEPGALKKIETKAKYL